MKRAARDATRFGAGNCDENAGGGDDVFCAYDLEQASESVREWGTNAVIVGMCMNDA